MLAERGEQEAVEDGTAASRGNSCHAPRRHTARHGEGVTQGGITGRAKGLGKRVDLRGTERGATEDLLEGRPEMLPWQVEVPKKQKRDAPVTVARGTTRHDGAKLG